MRYRTPLGHFGEVETIALAGDEGGFSTVVRDHHGHIIEPEGGHGYFDRDQQAATDRHDEIVDIRMTQIEATEAKQDASDD